MHVGFTQTKNVNQTPYFLGVSFLVLAQVQDSYKKRRQIRIGLIWWHVVLTYNW